MNTQQTRLLRTGHRRMWATAVDLGLVSCARCHEPINPGQPWDMGHVVDVINGGDPLHMLPEHASCNRSAGGRVGNRRRARPRRQVGEYLTQQQETPQ
ncbi:MAG: hypothetical protein ACRCZD_12750 [Phycicoccus sp.]